MKHIVLVVLSILSCYSACCEPVRAQELVFRLDDNELVHRESSPGAVMRTLVVSMPTVRQFVRQRKVKPFVSLDTELRFEEAGLYGQPDAMQKKKALESEFLGRAAKHPDFAKLVKSWLAYGFAVQGGGALRDEGFMLEMLSDEAKALEIAKQSQKAFTVWSQNQAKQLLDAEKDTLNEVFTKQQRQRILSLVGED